jgi:hypothetical protein
MNITSPTGLRIHLRHVRAIDPAGGPLCAPGIRAWCRQHAIDLRALCADGIDIDAHPQLHDDPFVVRAIAIALIEAKLRDATHDEAAHASERADAP